LSNIKTVQTYINYLLDKDMTWKYPYCQVCDSDLCMLPGFSEKEEVYLFCLGYGCNFKRYLGQQSIDEMSEFLEIEGIKTPA